MVLHRRIATVALAAIPAWAPGQLGAQAAARPADRTALARTVDSLAEAAIRNGPVAGLAIAVVRGRDTVVMKGYGKADVELGVPATATTVFRIGSVTKQFTSAGIMRLAEQGKLSLDDDVTKYVPNAPVQGRKVTIRHLLNHTSGIPSYTDVGPRFAGIMRQAISRDSLIGLVRRDSLMFEPGTGFYYNNTGYYLLGMVIEKVTGRPYGEWLKEDMFTPLGLAGTMYCADDAIIPNRARGYDRTQAGLRNASYIDMNHPYAAGSLCSTVGDLVAWTRAVAGGKVVSAASYKAMTSPIPYAPNRTMSYGFGLGVGKLGTHARVSHGGGINGFISSLAHYPDDSLVIAVLANTSPAPSDALLDNIARVAFGMPLRTGPDPVADVATTPEERAAFLGDYVAVAPDGRRMPGKVVERDGRLVVEITGQPPLRLKKQNEPNTFAPDGGPGRFIFDVANGKATGFVWDRGSRPIEARRVGAP